MGTTLGPPVARRRDPASVAARLVHVRGRAVHACGLVEPSGDIAGDTFDFAIERDTLHVSITDAMGHAINASVLATILVGALRNARRAGVELGEQARLANAGLGEYTGWSDFVTGQVARIDLR